MIKKLLLFGGIGFIVLFALVALFAESDDPIKVNGDSKTTAQNEQNDLSSKVFSVGDTVKIGDTELSITSASIQNPEQYNEAKNGKVLVLEVKGKNNGSQSWFLSDADFNLYSKDGNKFDPYYSTTSDPLTGELNQGKQIQGKILFDVKQSDTYELIYKPNFLTDQEIKFNIQPK